MPWPGVAVHWRAAPPAMLPSQKEVLALQGPLEGKTEVKITKYHTAKNTHTQTYLSVIYLIFHPQLLLELATVYTGHVC